MIREELTVNLQDFTSEKLNRELDKKQERQIELGLQPSIEKQVRLVQLRALFDLVLKA